MYRSLRKLFSFLLFVSLLLASNGIQTVHAAPDIIVNSAGDTTGTCATSGTGTCSLRDAITFANTQSGADIIVFDASLSGATINLSSTLPDISDDLTIDASALPSMLTISGQSTVRVMIVTSSGSLTLDTVTISSGYAEGGAGILNAGTLTVANSTLYNNYAPNNGRGGGIYNNGGTVTITNSTFVYNRTYTGGGGGIYSPSGSVTIEDSTFTNNRTSAVGGAIFNTGSLSIVRSTFSENLSLYEGGAIYNNGSLTISDDSELAGNQSQGNAGGAIFNSNSAQISDTTITGNSSRCYGGGAILNYAGTLNITRSTLANNAAYNYCGSQNGSRGGGISINDGTVTVINSTFYNNYAPDYGGAIYKNLGTLNVLNDTLSGNNTDLYGGGGGLYLNDGATNLINTIIANSGGGDCYGYIGYLATKNNNLVEDALFHCLMNDGENGNIIGYDPVLDSLADNGGPTQTMKLLSGSPAIDAGDNTTCHSLGYGDQRDYYRGLGGDRCDIGAYEVTGGIPTVESSSPANSGSLTGRTTITVTYDQAMIHDGSNRAANYIPNYLLVEDGDNNVFDTLSCDGGVQSDDTQVTFTNATYNEGTDTATLTLPSAVPGGTYRLFVCGTTSVWSAAEIELNNGDDTEINFSATGSGGGTSSTTPATLPATGFAPGRVTVLPEQPPAASYSTTTDLQLVIPALDVVTPIVGIPQNNGTWDVSWLGEDAGWLYGSAYPTWQGNTVLTGHVWNADNTPGIFVNLKQLQYGDRFTIEAYGQIYTYEVRENKLISRRNVDGAFKHESLDWVTLLSCEQYDPVNGIYPYRRLVRAVLVAVE